MATMVRTVAEPLVVMPVREPAVARRVRDCADCRFAEIYAEQPRAVCTCASSVHAARAVFSGQPVCSHCEPRTGDELVLAWCSPGRKVMHSRFLRVPPRR